MNFLSNGIFFLILVFTVYGCQPKNKKGGSEKEKKKIVLVCDEAYELINTAYAPMMDSMLADNERRILLDATKYPLLIYKTFIQVCKENGIDTVGMMSWPWKGDTGYVLLEWPKKYYAENVRWDSTKLRGIDLISFEEVVEVKELFDKDIQKFYRDEHILTGNGFIAATLPAFNSDTTKAVIFDEVICFRSCGTGQYVRSLLFEKRGSFWVLDTFQRHYYAGM